MAMKDLFTRVRLGKTLAMCVAVPAVLCSSAAYSATAISTTAHITSVSQFGNGHISVLLDTTIQDPTCPAARFDVDGTHPNIKAILATLMMAQSTGIAIRVGTYGCFTFLFNGASYTFPTLDTTDQSFVRLMQ